MEENAYFAWLLDFYGKMLTPRQRFLLEQHLNEDFSISEIARLEGISRQGVYDAIKKAEEQLKEYEEKLGLFQRYFYLLDLLKKVREKMKLKDYPGAQKAIEDYLESEEASNGI